MLKKIMLICIMIMASIVFARKDVMPMDVTQFQWKNRLLFLFAPDSCHPFFETLGAEINAQEAEVKDRDLVVFKALEREPSRMGDTLLDKEAADAIRKRFAAAPNRFTVILVGKDGGIKLKRNEQTDLRQIFTLIDSMPMRQNEMRQNKQRF